MKKAIIISSIMLLAAGIAVFFYFKRTPAVSYKTAKVEKGTIVASISATGTVNAVTTVQVGSQVSGTIQKLLVDYNSRVRQGQVIAEIDPGLFMAQVEQARGNNLNAQATLQKAKVTLADARRTLERNRQLLAQGIIAQSDLDAAQTSYDAALAGIKSAEAGVVQTNGSLQQARINLKNSIIRSPVEGVVISRNVDVGQTVAASFQTPTLFTIARDLTKMQIETSVDEADISRTQVGQTATFTVDAYPDKRFSGKISQVRSAPITVQNVVTYIVVIQVDNGELLLKPGMTANVSIETGRREDVIKIPSAALRFRPKDAADKDRTREKKSGEKRSAEKRAADSKRQRVFILKDGKPSAVTIQTGMSDATTTEMASGDIKPGDEIIIEQIEKGRKKGASAASGGRPQMGPRF